MWLPLIGPGHRPHPLPPMRQLFAIAVATAACSVVAPQSADATEFTSYHIGNSLTWDTRPRATPALSSQVGIDHTSDYHIRGSQTLYSFVLEPNAGSQISTTRGPYTTELPSRDWDVVTLQTYISRGTTLQRETDAAATLIDVAQRDGRNADTRFVIYGSWGQTPGDYHETFNQTGPIGPNTRASNTFAFQQEVARVTAELRPDANVEFLSLGKLFDLADAEIKSAVAADSDWFGFTDVDQLYRDRLHASQTGRWLASTAMWSFQTGESAVGLEVPPVEFGSAGERIYQDAALRDGLAAFAFSSLPAITAVPEPTSAVVGLSGLLLLSGRRARSARGPE